MYIGSLLFKEYLDDEKNYSWYWFSWDTCLRTGLREKKLYDPKQANEIAKRAVSQLTEEHALKNGDLIFQTSLSRQSRAFNWQQNRSIRIAGSFMKKMVCSMF